MPKSKRSKQVDLTKTKKRGMELKKHLYEEVRSCIDKYAYLYIFSINDMRNSMMGNVRQQWRHSRFFIGKNKVMALAFGKSPNDEYKLNLHKISENLKGPRGLLFTNQSKDEVLNWFESYSVGDFARSGNRATQNVYLHEGPLPQFPHNLEPYLRQLGLPTTLQKGVIHLTRDHEVCKLDDILTPETAKILKLLGYEMAEFHIQVECFWSQDGSFVDFMKTPLLGNGKNIQKSNSLDQNGTIAEEDIEMNEESDENTKICVKENSNKKQENTTKAKKSKNKKNKTSIERAGKENSEGENNLLTEKVVVTESTSIDGDIQEKQSLKGNQLTSQNQDCANAPEDIDMNEEPDNSKALVKEKNEESNKKKSVKENIIVTSEENEKSNKKTNVKENRKGNKRKTIQKVDMEYHEVEKKNSEGEKDCLPKENIAQLESTGIDVDIQEKPILNKSLDEKSPVYRVLRNRVVKKTKVTKTSQ